MIAIQVAALAVATGIGAPEIVSEVSAGENTRVSVIVFFPKDSGIEGVTPTSLMRAAEAVLEQEFAYDLLSAEQIGVDVERLVACDRNVRMTCWLRAIQRGGRAPGLVAVLGLRPDARGQTSVSALLVDVKAGLQELDGSADPLQVEDRVFQHVVQAPLTQVYLNDPSGPRSMFEKLFRGAFANKLRAAGNELGRFEIQSEKAGLQIQIDGRPVGQTLQPAVTLVDVRTGSRNIEVLDGRRTLLSSTIDIKAGPNAAVVVPWASPGMSSASRAVLWSGIGLVGLGAAITVVAATSAASATPTGICVDCDSIPEPGFRRLGPFLGAPLGYSLIATGGSFALGAALFEADSEVPWWSVATGLVAGGLSYGLSAALE